ncbi:MAG: transposase [Candidatus Acidiferrales bacterium]
MYAHWDDVLSWFQTPITNGVLEAINSLVQAAQRAGLAATRPTSTTSLTALNSEEPISWRTGSDAPRR